MPEYKFTNFFLASLTDDEFRQACDCLPEEEKPFDPAKPNSLTSDLWNTCLELTWNHGTESDPNFKVHDGNAQPQGFGHIGFLIDDLETACVKMEENGAQFRK